jgi:hypothetical protein
MLVVAAVVTLTAGPAAMGGTITGLNLDVSYDGQVLGDIRLHVGTHNFQADGRDGIGRATPSGEQSGFRPVSGQVLNDVFATGGFDHLNWLQVVTAQPAAHNGPFGPAPHCDPSSAPGNTTPHDLDPWYLNEVPTNPPFDLPAGTASLLEFQDFPNALPWNRNESFSADVYLVGVLDAVARTYTTLASFTWTLTRSTVAGEMRVRMTDLAEIDPGLPQGYQDLAFGYEGRGWTYVPEPAGIALVLAAVFVRRRAVRC